MNNPLLHQVKMPHLPGASCAAEGFPYSPEIFYPETTMEETENLRILRTICKECPAVAECLKFALDNQEPWGIWAGTTPLQRKKLLGGTFTNSDDKKRLSYYNALIRLGLTKKQALSEMGIGERQLERIRSAENKRQKDRKDKESQ